MVEEGTTMQKFLISPLACWLEGFSTPWGTVWGGGTPEGAVSQRLAGLKLPTGCGPRVWMKGELSVCASGCGGSWSLHICPHP